MEITKTYYAPTREAWRRWLEKHYRTEKEVWLVNYRKESGKSRIPYQDTVKEALCFGWIDSTIKKIDGESNAQKFSPRNPKSPYSQANKERLKILIAEGRVAADVLPALEDIDPEKFVFPADVLDVLRANPRAWENFQAYSPPYQRIRIAFIDSARTRPDEFKKRLSHFLRMTERNKQYGYGIEEFFS